MEKLSPSKEFHEMSLYRPIGESSVKGTVTSGSLNYTYDAGSRLTAITDTNSLAPDFQFVYDTRGQLQNELQNHKLMAKNVLFDRDYDSVGNRIKLEANLGGSLPGTSIVGGLWDLQNNYVYDGMNRLSSVTQSNRSGGNAVSPKLATFAYDAASQLTDLRRYSATAASTPNLEVHSRMGYDLAGRLTSITHGKIEIAAGQTWTGTSVPPASLGTINLLAAYALTYDQDNRLTSLSSWRDAAKTSYTYNTTDQLTAATSTQISGLTLPFALPVAESYNFDNNGNRKSSTGASQSTAGSHNRLQTDGTYNYTYDNEGNTTRRTKIVGGQVTDYAWDQRNRLTSVTEKVSATGATTKKTEFVYDAFNQRVGRRLDVDGNGTWDNCEVYVWADGQEVLRFVDSDGQTATQPFRVANRYLWGTAVDQLLSDEQYMNNTGAAITSSTASTVAGNTLWAVSDHLGSVRDVVDNNGVVRQHLVFDSFGRRVREVDYSTTGAVIASTDPTAVDELFGYTGRDFDTAVGLQYNRERWYDPATGRWLSNDPIGFNAGDANLYRYVGNQSTTYTDPRGLVLIAVDGTGSTAFRDSGEGYDFKTRRYRSHTRNFYEDYVMSPGEQKFYFDGPCNTMTGSDSDDIHRGVMSVLLPILQANPDETINLVGHSRGGYIVMEVARELKKRGYRVNFLGMYDAVDSAPGYGEAETIPSTQIKRVRTLC